MNYRKKWHRIAAAVLVLATLAAAYFSFSWERRQGVDRLQASAGARLNHFSLTVFAPLDKYAYLPSLVAAYPSTVEALRQPHGEESIGKANRLFQQLSEKTGAAVIYLMNLDGLTIAASNWQGKNSFVGSNYAFRPYFGEALRHGHGSFYGMGVTSHTPGYFISQLVSSGGHAIGVVVVKIDIHSLPAQWARGEHEIAVTDENGVIFLSSREDWKYRPIRPLAPAVQKRLKRIHQYDGVLKEPLPVRVQETLGAGEEIVGIDQDGGRAGRASYFVASREVPASDWTIHVLTSMAPIDDAAWLAAALAVAALWLLLLLTMYLRQLGHRIRERRESRHMLEQTLQALEEKHAELQVATEELRQASITDPLTGAFNRRFFLDTAAKMVSAANRHRQPLSVIMIDVDYFKRINDEYGHPAGDKVLQTLADICRKALREEDIFARFGGEEFAMLLPNTDEGTAQCVAERLREKLMRHAVEAEGNLIRITISSGVSRHRPEEKSIEAALRRADDALYEAKEGGRNRVAVL